jgi:hypothetical protein
MRDSYLTLLDMLRRTLENVEASQQLAPEDPAIMDLKPSVVLMIAELEFRLGESDAAEAF